MNDITVLLATSPMVSHPDTTIIDETIESIRKDLPDSEIILMFDACSDVNYVLKDRYEEYKRIMLWRIDHEYTNITPLVMETHSHQSLMTKKALEMVQTPLVLFMENDCPLAGEIPWDNISECINTGYANLVRFHHEATIPEDHKHLMLDQEPIEILGAPYIRTTQWSQRPHLASTKFYREIANKYWDDQPRFIEHIMYGAVVEGEYDEFRLHIYAPSDTLVRSYHRDGRRYGAENYDPTPS